MRLCFGTYVTVLLHCARSNRIMRQLIAELTLTIDAESRFTEKKNDAVRQQVTRLFRCEANFSTGTMEGVHVSDKEEGPRTSLTDVWEKAGKLKTVDISHKFQNVIGLISENKKAQAVLALLDIIDKDITLDHASGFEKYVGAKKDILEQKEIFLSDFLAGIFLYTVREVDNKVGIDSIKQITKEYVCSFTNEDNRIIVRDSNSLAEMQYRDKQLYRQMLSIFKKAIEDYEIGIFLNRLYDDPFNRIEIRLLKQVKDFLESIDHGIMHSFIYAQDNETYKDIRKFYKKLKNYFEYVSFYLTSDDYGITAYAQYKEDEEGCATIATIEDDSGRIYYHNGAHKELEWNLEFETNVATCCIRINSLHIKICDGISLLLDDIDTRNAKVINSNQDQDILISQFGAYMNEKDTFMMGASESDDEEGSN